LYLPGLDIIGGNNCKPEIYDQDLCKDQTAWHRIEKKLFKMYNFPIRSIKEILSSKAKTVTVSGWLSTVRSQKHVTFMNLVDGSNLDGMQLVMDNQPPLPTGTAIRATGNLQPYKNGVELKVEKLEVLGKVKDGYPLYKGRIPLDTLRQFPHLRQRTTTFAAIARVRSALIRSVGIFMEREGFTNVNPPILTSNDCEGGGEAFKVSTPKRDFFGRDVYLTVSSQLHLEFMASAMSRVYTIQNCFRAEPSDSTRHLAEFGMLEVEMAFVDLNQLMDFCEAQIKFTIDYLLKNCRQEIEFFEKYVHSGLISELNGFITESFVRITYDEAVTLLLKQDKVEWKYYILLIVDIL
jgi:asparaginyl-tRNA synthetase